MTLHIERDIGSEDLKITEIVSRLRKDEFLIPTFQRDFVWKPENILKLWDSIFRFYPIGSLLYWETDSYLHTHRKLGGFDFPHDEDTVRQFKDWKYILDGQQRATSMLVSYLGGTGKVEGNEAFDYTVHFDASDATFFFAGGMEERSKTTSPAFLPRLRDIPEWTFEFYSQITQEVGYTPEIGANLSHLERVFKDYSVSVVRIRGVEVSEVCEIFERINQEGKKLHPVDIIVARTYRTEGEDGKPGFYLRDNLAELNEKLQESGSQFRNLDDLNVIQMFALCLRKKDTASRSRYGITPASLDNLTCGDFEENWSASQKTIEETVKFMTNNLSVRGPGMLPFMYLMLSIAYYLHENRSPRHHLLRQWFWRTAFGLDDFRSSSDLYEMCAGTLGKLDSDGAGAIPELVLSKKRLMQSSYNYRNALSRAVLAFYATRNPLDFADPHAKVLDNVYLNMSQAPNLHHVYPLNFLKPYRKSDSLPEGVDENSLMNICFLRAKTNIQISDNDPFLYLRDYAKKVQGFDRILDSHMIDQTLLTQKEFEPSDFAEFLKKRAERFCQTLKSDLPDVKVTITE